MGVASISPPEPMGPESLRRFLAGIASPALLLVDVFPRGLLGELDELRHGAGSAWLVTRRVRPAYYRHPPVREALLGYARVFWTEEPPQELENAFPAERLRPLLLALPPLRRREARARLGVRPKERLILAVGAGGQETQARLHRLLVLQARRLSARLVFLSRVLPEGGSVTHVFPAAPLLPAADVIVAAGGYHSFHEARAAGRPSVFLPQWRRYDDQEARVRSGLVARSPESLERALRAILNGRPPQRARLPRLLHPEKGATTLARLVEEALGSEDGA
jgi:UDP:flavonoid glycosyltransferase YjiC (YdhE family)